jgi:ubiquinone/menaquinone biosynthesis C-methylase UbiE
VFDPPYLTIADDVAEAQRLASRFDELDFAGLVRWKYVSSDLPADLLEKYTRFRLQNVSRGRQRVQVIQEALATVGRPWPAGAGLDLGCGTGGMVAALAAHCDPVAGADIFLTDLILAKRLLADHGLTADLVCCCAEHLPFPDGAFGLINSNDTIEHVRAQGQMLTEALRVLADPRADGEGSLALDTPNRFALWTPEPHVNLRWVGFLPRALQARYVWLRRRTHYKEIRLLSLAELDRLVGKAVGDGGHAVLYRAPVDLGRAPRSWRGRLLRRLPWLAPWLNRILKYFVFNYDVLAWRAPAGGPTRRSIRPFGARPPDAE